MTTKVQKWGNSYGVRIPKEIMREMNFRDGTPISFSLEGDSIIITHTKKAKYTLNDLLKNFNKNEMHDEQFSGTEIGNEVVVWEK